VKVGKTTVDVKARLASIQTGSPVQLRVIAKFRTSHVGNAELLMHAALAPWRRKGEWFDCSPELAQAAWRQIKRHMWPKQVNSPQAWDDAHRAMERWGVKRLKDHPKPVEPVDPDVHQPPFGPPLYPRPVRVQSSRTQRRPNQRPRRRRSEAP
jgi:hypothetical protein